MGLYEQWQNLIEHQTDETFKTFWDTYSSTEKKIYSDILKRPNERVTGTFKNLTEKYEADPVIFMGFLDGIHTSLKNEQDFKNFSEDSTIELDIDLEKLYYNMLEANAEYLYNLPEWDNIFTEEKTAEIVKAFRKSRTVVKDKLPGRNDPCICGSGKKYKKCCGA